MIPEKNQSPHLLLQELLWPDRWKCTVACILLNCTKRAQVNKVWPELFSIAPTPEALLKVPEEDLKKLLKPLGFSNRRTNTLKKLSHAWGKVLDFSLLPGVGKYAYQSDRIFFFDEIPEDVEDHALKSYVEWRKQQNFFLNDEKRKIS